MIRHLKDKAQQYIIGGAFAVAFGALAYAQGFNANNLLAGTPLAPSVASNVDTAHGLYFGTARVAVAGHLESGLGSGMTPTLGTCTGGAITAGSTDSDGGFTGGTATSCAVVFGTAYAAAPSCVAIPGVGTGITGVFNISALATTGFTMNSSAGNIVAANWHCTAKSGG